MDKDNAGSQNDTYQFLFSDKPLNREIAQLGFVAVDFENGKRSSSTPWNYWKFDSDTGTVSIVSDNLHPDDVEKFMESYITLEAGKTDEIEQIFRVKSDDNEWLWILHRGCSINKSVNGHTGLYIGVETDISDLKDAEESLLQQKAVTEQRAMEAETLLKAGAVITSSLNIDETVNLILEQTRLVVPYKKASVQILTESGLKVIGGYGFEDMSAVIGLELTYPEEGSHSTKAIQSKRAVICGEVMKVCTKYVEPDLQEPTQSWIGIPLIFHGEVIGLLTLDHTQRNFYTEKHLKVVSGFAVYVAVALANARLHEKTYRMAMEDSLMKIGSRHSFELQGEIIYATAKRNRHSICLALADIDFFKKVNDNYGHNIGDLVLRDIGAICRAELRLSDVVARFGGEEIIFLFSDIDNEAARTVMARIRSTISKHRFGPVKERLSVSVGIASQIPQRGDKLENLIKKADEMLYKAKENGRDRIEVGPKQD